MRYAFFMIIIVLLELFSLGAALSLQWWLQPWVILIPTLKPVIFSVIFAVSNGLLLLSVSKLFSNGYRWISGWMLVMHFMMLTALLTSLLYGGSWLISVVFAETNTYYDISGLWLRAFALVVFVGLFICAVYSAYIPVVRKRTIHIDKPMAAQLRIAVASDLHIGRLFGRKAIDRLQRLVVQSEADMLLMPGDIMDDNTQAYTAFGMSKQLENLCQSLPYGVYATLGNHDLYGHEQSISYALRQAGVQLLTDDVRCIDYKSQPIWLVGRFDNHKSQRVATTELLAQVNTDEPVILLDHRPSDILLHSQLPIDLQVSGHTHNGQIFPANFIVKAINRLGYGYEAIGQGHFVVSSGYGFWGIPFRLGSRSEIWLITLTGQS
ncbi:metallophosphoesterase [Psychrobacter urativorans]|uniref:Metallophosphoesterase n=1 Tax=Psychrobacter urativorans TaxID=45610 RepID=A0A0M4U6T0_9GAMM|nr:metallophosphoesterase [Psychrobacter urativorans]ALF59701.1 metallophosphoesterase [Psychrobacter urativorans]